MIIKFMRRVLAMKSLTFEVQTVLDGLGKVMKSSRTFLPYSLSYSAARDLQVSMSTMSCMGTTS